MSTRFTGARLVFAALTLSACASTPSTPPRPAPAASVALPEPNELRRDLLAFAADSVRGRETRTPDADRAAQLLASRLASLGVAPAGDSGFFQRVPMIRWPLAASEIALATPKGRV